MWEMSTVDEIESAIEQLPPEDFRALHEWIAKRAAGAAGGAERKWSPDELTAGAKRMVDEPDSVRAEAIREEIARGFYGAADA